MSFLMVFEGIGPGGGGAADRCPSYMSFTFMASFAILSWCLDTEATIISKEDPCNM